MNSKTRWAVTFCGDRLDCARGSVPTDSRIHLVRELQRQRLLSLDHRGR